MVSSSKVSSFPASVFSLAPFHRSDSCFFTLLRWAWMLFRKVWSRAILLSVCDGVPGFRPIVPSRRALHNFFFLFDFPGDGFALIFSPPLIDFCGYPFFFFFSGFAGPYSSLSSNLGYSVSWSVFVPLFASGPLFFLRFYDDPVPPSFFFCLQLLKCPFPSPQGDLTPRSRGFLPFHRSRKVHLGQCPFRPL